MNKIIFIFLFCVTSIYVYSQKPEPDCDCSVILIPQQEWVPLFNYPGGKITGKLMNDTTKENYVVFTLIKTKNDYAYVIGGAVLKDTLERRGWIEKRLLGIYPGDYSKPVKLYSKPDKSSKVNISIMYSQYSPLEVIDCKNGWLLVELIREDNTYSGWLPPDNQCANPYTVCN